MKKVEFELSNGVYETGLEYKKKRGLTHDSGALYTLLTELRYSELDVLRLIFDAVMTMIECNVELSEEQKELQLSIGYSLCECDRCEKGEIMAHTDAKSMFWVSRKRFNLMLGEAHLSFGLFDLIHNLLHELLHIFYPRLTEKSITLKTAKFFRKGAIELSKMAHQTGL